LREIVRFIKKENREAAEQFGYRLIDKALSLATFPERGRFVPELRDGETREISLGSSRIFYYVDKIHEEVYVVRFWHAARGEPLV
jgi:toxin ParE1/3/4